MRLTPTELADVLMGAARTNYERDGHLTPVLLMHVGDQELIVGIDPQWGEHLARLTNVLVKLMRTLRPVDQVALVAEMWVRKWELSDAPEIRRGQLQSMASAGDMSVHTLLMAHCMDADGTWSARGDEVHRNDDGSITWEVSTFNSEDDGADTQGAIPEGMSEALTAEVPLFPERDEISDQVACALFTQHVAAQEWATQAVVVPYG